MAIPENNGMVSNGLNPHMTEVGMGELVIAQHPVYLMTSALGSCVAVTLWDSALKQGALAHVMLPTPHEVTVSGREERFASHAIPKLVRLLSARDSSPQCLVAKIAGGAAMFRNDTDSASIGERNVKEVKRQLRLLHIPLHAEDIGGGHARTVEFHLDTGRLVVRSYRYGMTDL